MKWLKGLFLSVDEYGSIGESILENICIHCVDQGWDRVAVTETPGSDRTVIWGYIAGEWVWKGELPAEQNFLRRTRFVSNSKFCADLRFPANRTESIGDGRKFEVLVEMDVDIPTARLEFSVRSID